MQVLNKIEDLVHEIKKTDVAQWMETYKNIRQIILPQILSLVFSISISKTKGSFRKKIDISTTR